MTEHAWSRQEFEQKLREKGAYYHIHHPFHKEEEQLCGLNPNTQKCALVLK